MNVEMAFRIYHRLLRKSADYCETVIIEADKEADRLSNPTAVIVKFIPRRPRALESTEITHLKEFCRYHKVEFEINEKGEMIWKSHKPVQTPGKRKHGPMSFQ